jgi:hypothetical protein
MEYLTKRGQGGLSGRVTHSGQAGPIRDAEVRLFRVEAKTARKEKDKIYAPESAIAKIKTDSAGGFRFDTDLEDGSYLVRSRAFGITTDAETEVVQGIATPVALDIDLGLRASTHVYGEGDRLVPALRGMVGKRLVLRAESAVDPRIETFRWNQPRGAGVAELSRNEAELMFTRPGPARVELVAVDRDENELGGRAEAVVFAEFGVSEQDLQMIGGQVGVTMHRTAADATLDQALWVAIRNRTHAIEFTRYREFINRVLRWDENERYPEAIERRMRDLGANMHGVGAYQLLKLATEVFLLMECGVRIDRRIATRIPLDPLDERSRLGDAALPEQMQARLHEYLGTPAQLPYITRVVEAAFPDYDQVWPQCDRVLTARINEPCLIELIWSYWHEEGMLMQTIGAISQRFQNVRRSGERDPLANMEIDPLRPLNNLLWGFVQDEVNRLSVKRRAYEYMHQYGLVLYGKITPELRPADNRSKFLEAFHNLLYQASVFFKEDFQTTVIADGFPLLNSLQEVHMVLAEGAHNQFGDLSWTARVEMLLTEYMLARPEIRDFLQSRAMIPYKEAWMPQVDSMKVLQGWSDVSVAHFRDLGVYGEQLLLSIRYGDWIHVNNEDSAKNWARYWRPEIQGYLHSYRVATGIDLTNPDTVDATIPALHLQKRLASQQARLRP